MIKFDYKIVRDEGDEKRTYTPSIAKQLDDLVYIEGPNSSGKSTLLHMLALGLFGLKNKNIKDSLQRKLTDLAGSGHQELTFSFSITNDRNKLSIVSQKKHPTSTELTVYETIDGRQSVMTSDSFEQRYNLIYDIPDDPLERLEELTKQLKDRQASVGRSVADLEMQLLETIKEVQNSQDPKRLEQIRRQVKELAGVIGDLDTERTDLTNDLTLLRRYYGCKYFLVYRQDLEERKCKIQNLEQELKKLKKIEKSAQRKVKVYAMEAREFLGPLETLFKEIVFTLKVINLKTKEDYLAVWGKKDLRELFVQDEQHPILFDGIKAFRDKLKTLDAEIGTDSKLDEANLLDELIQVLQHYSSVKATLPGTDKSIPEFMSALEKRFRECRDIKVQHDKYHGLIGKLAELESKSRTFVTVHLAELKTALDEDKNTNHDDQEEELGRDIDQMKRSMGAVARKVEYFREEMIKSGVKEKDAEAAASELDARKELRPYRTYDEGQLEDKLSDLQQEIELAGKKIKENEYLKGRQEYELHRLEEKKPHRYQDRIDELNDMLQRVQVLKQKLLKEFEENLKKLRNKALRKSDLTKSQVAYFDAVATYLARRVGSIRHVEKDYILEKIDLVERKLHTKSGKIILLTDLGTGQSQSAYLKGLLDANDGRKIIALIDEVAMMDSRSMEPIYQLLRRRYDNGSLLAAIVVQKGETLSVKPIS